MLVTSPNIRRRSLTFTGKWQEIRPLAKTSRGYIKVYMPRHPTAFKDGYVFQHTLIAEKALGHFLPKKACIHHVNENRADNRSANLVICEDRAYHNLLHRRAYALQACGDANSRHCWVCDQWFSPDDLDIWIGREGKAQQERVKHLPCLREQNRQRWHRRQAEKKLCVSD